MSTRVCFVCGNSMLEDTAQLLFSRVPSPVSRYECPFFPFLEYHDPAPGADPMSENWTILSCQVCKAFLIQQWDSFEKMNVPINKRLYWLKRPSGCEIRQPVSQIELEEILNEHAKGNHHEKNSAPNYGGDHTSSDESSSQKS